MTPISASLPATSFQEPKRILESKTINWDDNVSISMKPLRDKGKIVGFEATLPDWSDAKCAVSREDRLRRFDSVVRFTNPEGIPTDYTAARNAFVRGFVDGNIFHELFGARSFFIPVGK